MADLLDGFGNPISAGGGRLLVPRREAFGHLSASQRKIAALEADNARLKAIVCALGHVARGAAETVTVPGTLMRDVVEKGTTLKIRVNEAGDATITVAWPEPAPTPGADPPPAAGGA